MNEQDLIKSLRTYADQNSGVCCECKEKLTLAVDALEFLSDLIDGLEATITHLREQLYPAWRGEKPQSDGESADECLFERDDIKAAVNTVHQIRHLELDSVNPYDLLTAVEALDRQYPKWAHVTHKSGEDSALIECPLCGRRTIVDYKIYRENYTDWYCKQCGQRLEWPVDNADTCVCRGDNVPEGRQVCPACVQGADNNVID